MYGLYRKGMKTMTNYICINGKKAELTEEQMKALGIELPKANPFEKVEWGHVSYHISCLGKIEMVTEYHTAFDRQLHEVANYCTDKSLMEQRALHETLNRLLWRYSMEHGGDNVDWSDPKCPAKYYILFDHANKKFTTHHSFIHCCLTACFYSEEIAEAAIKEIIEPFMKAHPEFKW